MKIKNKKRFTIVIICILLIVLLMLVVLLKNKKSNQGSNNSTENTSYNTVVSEEDSYSKYYTIKSLINIFCDNVDTISEVTSSTSQSDNTNEEYRQYAIESIENCLSDEYIKKYSVNDNYITKTLSSYYGLEYDVEKIYKVSAAENIDVYYVYGDFNDKEYDFAFVLDYANSTYEMYLNNYFADMKISQTDMSSMLNINAQSIEKNEDNTFINKTVSDENIAESMYDEFKSMLNNDVEGAYELLDSDYRKARFSTLESFKNYVKEKISVLNETEISQYLVGKYGDYDEFVCMDDYGYKFIFRVTSYDDYTVFLDSYTCNIDTYINDYNNADDSLKAQKCLGMFIDMLNTGDYETAYSKLNSTFKSNFKSVSDFEKYVKDAWLDSMYFNYDDSSFDNQNYTFNGTLMSYEERGNYEYYEIEENFIVKLGDDMKSFEIAFGM